MTNSLAKPRRLTGNRILRASAVFLILGGVLVATRAYFAFRDRLPGFALKLEIPANTTRARPLQVGFSKIKINPDISGAQGPIYLAGFGQNRKATSVHDDLWAIACVIDDGYSRLGIVSLDAIGFFHDDAVRVRQRLGKEWKLDYTIICSTHNHSTPDLMGLWGPSYLRTGVNRHYLEMVREACVHALGGATSNLQPARVSFQEIATESKGLVADTRKPVVFDPNIRVMQFIEAASAKTLGSIVGWADHPETPWSENTEITADYCGYLRDILENGVTIDGRKIAEGLGGVHLYINGAIGGLMTTPPGTTVRDPYLNQDFQKPSHEKARALGRQLAFRLLFKMQNTNTASVASLPISIFARTIELPLRNNIFLLAGYLGILDRGYVHWRTLRTEVALITLGDASVACIPGEIYPEIVNGGIEQATGGDFQISPLEVPPIRELMPGRVKFVFGLANDEVGYLIPKSEWDQKPPYLYGASHAPYGEINSVGPEAASCVQAAIKEACRIAGHSQ